MWCPTAWVRCGPLLSDGGGGGAFWGCLRTGQPTHPPKLTHLPTHPDPPYSPDPLLLPSRGGGGISSCIICPLHTENFEKGSGT